MIEINGKDFDQAKARVEKWAGHWAVFIGKTPVDYYKTQPEAEQVASAIRRLSNGRKLHYNAREILCIADIPLVSPRGSHKAAS